MKEEIKTSKTIGYVFAGIGSLISLIAILATANGINLLFISPFLQLTLDFPSSGIRGHW